MFLSCYRISDPVLKLNDVVHWYHQMHAIDCTHSPLGSEKTYVFGGYIYNFSSPVPSTEAICDALHEAQRLGVSQLLVPTVGDRENCDVLVSKGFVKIPSFMNVQFVVDSKLHEDLRRGVGAKRFKELNRLHRKAQSEYRLEIYSGEDLERQPNLIELASELHNKNTLKYSSPINFYSKDVIQELVKGSLSKNLRVGIRYKKSAKEPAQVLIFFVSEEKQELYFVVQGIDQQQVEKGQNLYIAGLMDVYSYANQFKVRSIYLGRGNHEKKISLGANRIDLLNHWIRSTGAIEDEVEKISKRTFRALGFK